MENNESKDNNSEEELEQNTLKNKVMKRIRRKKIIIDTDSYENYKSKIDQKRLIGGLLC